MRGRNLHQERGVQKAGELVRRKGDAAALLLLRDEDDGCPKDLAPVAARWLRKLSLPFPSAVVLAHREFEAFFLPCLSRMAGRKARRPRRRRTPRTTCRAQPSAVIPNQFAALKSGCQGTCQWGAPTNRHWTNWPWRAWSIFRCCALLIRRSPASARSKEQSSFSINKCDGRAQKFILPE